MKFVIEGDVEPVQHKSRLELRVLDEHAELIVIGLLENPTLYLDEVVHKVAELTSIVVSPPTSRLLNAMASVEREANGSTKMLCSSWCFHGTFHFIQEGCLSG